MYQLMFALVSFTSILCTPCFAGTPIAPELDGGMLSGIAAGLTGCYAALRIYQAKRK